MKVILLQDIYKTGVAGEVVDVKAGFARNYLIPRKMAKQAFSSALREHANLMEQVEARRATYDNMLNDLGRQINGVELIFERRASTTGTLYGSVTTQDIADALNEATGIDINRRRISQRSIREVGQFNIPVRLGNEISPNLNVIVIRDGELEEFLAAREKAAEGVVIDPLTLEAVTKDVYIEEIVEETEEEVVEEVAEETEVSEEAAEEASETDETE
jgi:large subunit ribosomal protein L9